MTMTIAAGVGEHFGPNEGEDAPLLDARGVATEGGGETTTTGVGISMGANAADGSNGQGGGITGHVRRTARRALLPPAVLVLALVVVLSSRGSDRGQQQRRQHYHQILDHDASGGGGGGYGSRSEDSMSKRPTVPALSPPVARRASLDGGGGGCPYAITATEAEMAAADTDAAATESGGKASSPSPSLSFSSFFSSSSSSSFLWQGGDQGGNVLNVTSFNYSRLGNRFVSLTRNVNLGYCCKSKLVSLPPKDDIIAPGVFSEGVPGPRWFDFSGAPDVDGFDASTCPESITWGGQDAFYLTGVRDEGHPYYTPGLFECVKALPRLAGCEAAYFFPVGLEDVCLSDTTGGKYEKDERGHGEEAQRDGGDEDDRDELDGEDGGGRGSGGDLPRAGEQQAGDGEDARVDEEVEGEQRRGDASRVRFGWAPDEGEHEPEMEEWVVQREGGQRGRGREGLRAEDKDDGAGSSGGRGRETADTEDIVVALDQEREGEDGEGHGTGCEGEEGEGGGQEEGPEPEPAGSLVVHVRSGDIFVDPAHPAYGQPPLQYYLRAMEDRRWDRIDIVTNGLVDEYHVINPVVPALEARVAAGQLVGNIHFHKNRTMGEDLLSMICGDGFVAAKSTVRHLVSRHSSAGRIYFPHACDDKLHDLGNERPGVKIFGMVWQEKDYTVYQRWNNTQEQLSEIVTFGVDGFEQCGNRQLGP